MVLSLSCCSCCAVCSGFNLDLRIVLGNWLAFAMIGNPRGAGGTGIVRGTGGSITRGDRLICASGHGFTWMGGVPWFKGYVSGFLPMVKQPGLAWLGSSLTLDELEPFFVVPPLSKCGEESL